MSEFSEKWAWQQATILRAVITAAKRLWKPFARSLA